MEKEISGLYLSGHPLDQYRDQIERYATSTVSQLTGEEAEQMDGRQVTLVCTVVRTKYLTTRSDSLMAFVTVEDLSGSMELLVFPKTLTEYGDAIFDNAVVVVRGKVSVKEDEAAKLVADMVVGVDRYQPPQVGGESTVVRQAGSRPRTLYLKCPSMQGKEFAKVRDLLEIFSGDMPVRIRIADTGKLVAAPRNLWAMESPRLLEELTNLLGEGCVVVR